MNLTATVFHDDLVARCKEGDTAGYELLYRQYAKAMYNTSVRIVNNPADAEDVLQEAFIAAFRLDKFDYSSTFGAWLKRIVVNKSIDVLRKRRLITIDIDDTRAHELQDSSSEHDESITLKVGEIRKAVAQLPTGYRTVLSLSLFEGYDYDEIGEILKIEPGTVRTQYHRARKKLLQLLKQGGNDE